MLWLCEDCKNAMLISGFQTARRIDEQEIRSGSCDICGTESSIVGCPDLSHRKLQDYIVEAVKVRNGRY